MEQLILDYLKDTWHTTVSQVNYYEINGTEITYGYEYPDLKEQTGYTELTTLLGWMYSKMHKGYDPDYK